jgi:hypothetical protein
MAENDDQQRDEVKAAAGAKGGAARAEVLSPEERSEIASAAAIARWGGGTAMKRATHSGVLRISDLSVPVFVLQDGTRVISGRGFTSSLGMKGRGQGMARILSHKRLRPFIDNDLVVAIEQPLVFRSSGGGRPAYGYSAELLVQVAEAILDARKAGALKSDHETRYAAACEILMRSFARVGIIALVDEATGYQEVRDREALQNLLDRYLRAEYAKWAKRFPDDFYREMFRLRGWTWSGLKVSRPGIVGHYTNDIVYARLAPGVLDELKKLNPSDHGRRQSKHHQWLTDDIGHPALQAHLTGVVALMRGATTWDQFMRMIQRAYPKVNTNLDLPFRESD